MENLRELEPGEAKGYFLTGLIVAVVALILFAFMIFNMNINMRQKKAVDMLMVVQSDADQSYSKEFLSLAESAFLDDEITSEESNILYESYHKFEENKRLSALDDLKAPK